MRTIFFTLPLALAATAATFMLSAAPAAASTEACATAPAKLRAMSATAAPDAKAKAARNISLGEALCEARNRSEAAKKFDLAAKALGTDLAAVMAADKVALVQ